MTAEPEGPTGPEARAMALRYLARRDYAAQEMDRKLRQRGVDSACAAEVVAQLVEEDLVSDRRFAEIFCRQRMARRYGPARIRAELRGKGVGDALIRQVLSTPEEAWEDLAWEWVRRAFRGELTQKEKGRLYRSGCNRGFSHAQVMQALDRLARHAEV